MSVMESDEPPTVRDILECLDCELHYRSTPHLLAACASIGIESGKSTERLLLAYLATFHQHGHRNWGKD